MDNESDEVSIEDAARRLKQQSHPDTAPGGRTSNLRILFVEDDAIIMMGSVEMLEELGHSVTAAFSGAEALGILQSGAPFDLLITDFSMPKMTGGQLAVAARQIYPLLPILLTTGHMELHGDTGVDLPRLSKPYFPDQLQAAIDRAVNGEGSAAGDRS